eukprot:scaffold10451_cov121-Isochrysis_galbana.AAC.3
MSCGCTNRIDVKHSSASPPDGPPKTHVWNSMEVDVKLEHARASTLPLASRGTRRSHHHAFQLQPCKGKKPKPATLRKSTNRAALSAAATV